MGKAKGRGERERQRQRQERHRGKRDGPRQTPASRKSPGIPSTRLVRSAARLSVIHVECDTFSTWLRRMYTIRHRRLLCGAYKIRRDFCFFKAAHTRTQTCIQILQSYPPDHGVPYCWNIKPVLPSFVVVRLRARWTVHTCLVMKRRLACVQEIHMEMRLEACTQSLTCFGKSAPR
jgi:hypothetical protein